MKKSGKAGRRSRVSGGSVRQGQRGKTGSARTRGSAKAGLPPGTMVHVGERKTERTRFTVMEFADGTVREHEFSDVAPVLDIVRTGVPCWVNVYGLSDIAAVGVLASGLGLNALVREDIVNTSQTPRVEFFDDHIFVVLNTVKMEPDPESPESRRLDVDQISIVVRSGCVVAFHEEDRDLLDPIRNRIRSGVGIQMLSRPDYLAYAIMDVVVDNYFVVLESFGDAIDEMEADVLDRPDRLLASRIHACRRELLQIRRSIWPVREVMNRLTRDGHRIIVTETLPFMRDINDHVIQIVDMVELQREMLAGILDVYLSSISVRMNEVMKVLTIISTIFIPLTFLAGVYGMNFKNMPGIESDWGYVAVWAAFVVISGSLVILFKRKKWI